MVLVVLRLFIFLLASGAMTGYAAVDDSGTLNNQALTVDLREPHFSEGVLKTEQGGVITGPDLRIQARKILYRRDPSNGQSTAAIEAEGDLMLEFGDYVFVGSRLEYNFAERRGIIYNGRTAVEPWYFGGEVIELYPDGKYVLHTGYITTSECFPPEWEIQTEQATITEERYLTAKKLRFRFNHYFVPFLPSLKADLDTIFDSPIRYTLRFGGYQGTRFGINYEVFSWRNWDVFLQLDYRLKRGLGGGLETKYRSDDGVAKLKTINYVARDTSAVNPHENIRYRFQGLYSNLLANDALSVEMSWDKLSDKEMPTDYTDRGLELDTAGLTQLHLRYEQKNWISNFFTRARLNTFQTVKQELPTLYTQWRPMSLGATGIISDTAASVSYLDFKYSNGLANVSDYHSGRFAIFQRFYRPIPFTHFTLTPEAGGTFIYYTNSQENDPKWVNFAQFGVLLNTKLHKTYNDFKHVIEPYIDYTYYTFPTTSPNNHYIFDIDDGWYRWNMLNFGIRQHWYLKTADRNIYRFLTADIWANAFFNTPTLPFPLPKIYANIIYKANSRLRYSLNTAWDIQRGMLDHFNLLTEWTLSPDMAIKIEYRHRDAYDWRKVDHQNFILDSFRPVQELLDSEVSDRRDTLLVHFFYRFHPKWALEFESRQGWNRRLEPNYNEFEVDVLTTIRSAWNVKLFYRHRVNDDRVAINLSIGINRPDCEDNEEKIPFLEF